MRFTRAGYRAVFLDSWQAMHKLLEQAKPLVERLDEPETCRELGRVLDLLEFQAGTSAAAFFDYCRATLRHGNQPGGVDQREEGRRRAPSARLHR